ncbi:MAG: GH3 auxin-responsive promoter family protein [Chloroflexi bacterium]|nr:GH3 auxin-responsive promoter family protein [Chloroflexota bacterium]
MNSPVGRLDCDERGGRMWERYCSFLDLSVEGFIARQEELLQQQLRLLVGSPWGDLFLGKRAPRDAAELRSQVPLTTYQDYLPYLGKDRENLLPVRPYLWAHTSDRCGSFKWVPYTRQAYDSLADISIACFILACASKKGEVNLRKGDRILYNLPPRPYMSGFIGFGILERFPFRPIIPLEIAESMDFKERTKASFREALTSGVDFVASMTSVLVKVGEDLTERANNGGGKLGKVVTQPGALGRLLKAKLQSGIEGRGMLPKDLWSPKAVMCWGIDTEVFRDRLNRHWGQVPYEVYACTEAGIIAMQAWNRRGQTLVPHAVFLEFLAENERVKVQQEPSYTPSTVLIDELQPGQRYELVITSFHGMPFVRYRVGHFVRVMDRDDHETGVRLPQVTFDGRADDLIDIAGFTRIDEKTIWRALVRCGINCADWVVRKEEQTGTPVLHLYLEDGPFQVGPGIARQLHDSLAAIDPFYRDLDRLLGIDPLRVTVLKKGTFKSYYEEKRKQGLGLLECVPSKMGPPDETVWDLKRLSSGG